MRRDWDQLQAWKEDNQYLLIFMSMTSFAIIPLRDVNDAQIYEYIKEKLISLDIPYKKIPRGAIISATIISVATVWLLINFFT